LKELISTNVAFGKYPSAPPGRVSLLRVPVAARHALATGYSLLHLWCALNGLLSEATNEKGEMRNHK
jgi:hypothetical protein